jgi:hypothetical protein
MALVDTKSIYPNYPAFLRPSDVTQSELEILGDWPRLVIDEDIFCDIRVSPNI